MSQQLPESAFCAGFYPTVVAAESAIDGLLAVGFTEVQIGVIVPKEFEAQFPKRFRHEESPVENSPARRPLL